VRLFLPPHENRAPRRRVPEPGLLVDPLAGGEDLRLPVRFVLERFRDETDRVQVLDLDAGAEGRVLREPHRHVRVAPHVPLFHVGVGHARVAQQTPQLDQVRGRFVGGPQIGLAHDLDERHARPVPVHERNGLRQVVEGVLVKELSGVLLQVNPDETDRPAAVRRVDLDRSPGREGPVVLRDLVTLRQVGVEVVLAREARVAVDLRSDGESEAHRQGDRFAVEDRKGPREPQADRAGRGVGRRADFDRTGAEDLRLSQELGMDLETDD